MTKAAPLIAIAVLLASGAVVACGGKKAGLSASQIVAQSATRTAAVKSFHLVVNIEHVPASSSGISLTYLEGDVAVPAALQARVGGTFHGVPLSSELIVLGTKHYLKDPFTGKWSLVSVAMNPAAFFDPAKGVLAVIKATRNVAADGSKKVGGVDSYRLKGKVQASALTPLLGNPASAKLLPVELWIGKSDLLLRRIRLSGAIAAGEGTNALRTVELSAFGEPVHIVAPAV
jgi:hypothetical protein